MLFMSCYFMLSHLLIAALWSAAGKGLTSWLLFEMFDYVFVTFSFGIIGQGPISSTGLRRVFVLKTSHE